MFHDPTRRSNSDSYGWAAVFAQLLAREEYEVISLLHFNAPAMVLRYQPWTQLHWEDALSLFYKRDGIRPYDTVKMLMDHAASRDLSPDYVIDLMARDISLSAISEVITHGIDVDFVKASGVSVAQQEVEVARSASQRSVVLRNSTAYNNMAVTINARRFGCLL